jgi:NAD(P)H-dependent FMN reductase
MKAAKRTLAGTWSGTLSFTTASGARQDVAVPQVPMMQDGNTVSATFQTSSSYNGSFSGTLRDASALGSSTEITGTITLIQNVSGRPPTTCRGADALAGTVNWTQMSLAAPQIVFECSTTFSSVPPVTSVTASFVRQQ